MRCCGERLNREGAAATADAAMRNDAAVTLYDETTATQLTERVLTFLDSIK